MSIRRLPDAFAATLAACLLTVAPAGAQTDDSATGWRLTLAGGRTFMHESPKVYEGPEFPDRVGGAEDGQYYAALGVTRSFHLAERLRRVAPARPLQFRLEFLYASAQSRVGSAYVLDDGGAARHALEDETLGLSAAVAWPLSARGPVRPYLLAGGGVYHKRLGSNPELDADRVSATVSATRAGVQLGFGIDVPLGRRALFLEARGHRLLGGWAGSDIVPVALGFRF